MSGLEEFFLSLGGARGCAFLFAASFAENLFPPMPGDTFVVLGAVLAGRGRMPFAAAYGATLAGSVLGFMACYAAGRRWGRALFHGPAGRWFSAGRLDRVERWFARYGDRVLVANRFLSGFRAVVSFAAGIAGMNPWRVLAFAAASAALWNGLLMAAGLWVGANWKTLVAGVQGGVAAVLAALLAAWAVRAGFRAARRRGRRDGNAP